MSERKCNVCGVQMDRRSACSDKNSNYVPEEVRFGHLRCEACKNAEDNRDELRKAGKLVENEVITAEKEKRLIEEKL